MENERSVHKIRARKVIFLGSNPAEISPDNTPWHPEIRSRKLVLEWSEGSGAEPTFLNVADYKTNNNKPLRVREIRAELDGLSFKLSYHGYPPVVAFGKTAAKAMEMLRKERGDVTPWLEMPHPSGKNYLLNDKWFLRASIGKLRRYLRNVHDMRGPHEGQAYGLGGY